MTTNLVQKNDKKSNLRTRLVPGILLIVAGLAILFLFGLNLKPELHSTFGLTPLGDKNVIPISDLVLPVQPAIYFLVLVTFFVGGWQLARGIRSNNLMVGLVAFCFVAAFLIWAAKGASMDLVGMMNTSLVRATPIALAALCGVVSERAAVINIAIEGIMLMAAMTSVLVATIFHNLFLGLLAGILTGMFVAALHAILVIHFKVDHIISGVAINIVGTGVSSFISNRYMQTNIDKLNNSGVFPNIPIPLLAKIPILGPVIFENNIIVYIMLILVAATFVLLFYTPWGLRTRAVGEHPKAADTLGINVYLTRYVNVILGGFIAGIGGAYFTIGSVGRFDKLMTAGKGFIGLAAMIFGNWNPIGALGSSLIFGFADSLQIKMQILNIPIPTEFLQMAPYIVTIVVLAGVVGRVHPPAADGQAYEKQ
ncbi:MAG: ABC transporter permease [Anaerolineales bacterium]|jgi:simple sugar transport system permease protein